MKINAHSLIVALLLPASLMAQSAQVHPNIERGIAAGKLYQFSNVDQINLFNGNLSLNLPLGGGLPVSEHLSYGLTLIYNSKVWDNQHVDLADGTPSHHKVPNRRSNAGLGWLVSLGRLIDPNETDVIDSDFDWRYESPDGSDHVLYPSLHPTDTATNASYTRDNTYLRQTTLATGNQRVEFPDGTIDEFEPYMDATIQRWRLKNVQDRFANHYDIAYQTINWTVTDINGVPYTYQSNKWVITDQHGRTTTVAFKLFSSSKEAIDAQQNNYRQVIDYIEVPAFNGGSPARYSFGYTNTSLRRGLCGEGDTDVQGDALYLTLPLLTSLTLPDGTQFTGAYIVSDLVTCFSGEITQLTLPTKGQIRWTYQDYQLPINGCDPEPLNDSPGVSRRAFVDPAGGPCALQPDGTSACTWTYTPRLTPEPDASWSCLHQVFYSAPPSEEFTNTVTTPGGDDTVNYFTVWPRFPDPSADRPDGATRLEYGLPFTRKTQDNGKYLSTQIYAGSGVGRVLQRSTYVTYERDSPSPCCLNSDLQFDANRRVHATRIVYNDDGNNSVDVNHDDFDGVGHYRLVTRDSTFRGSSTSARTTTTSYNVRDASINNAALATGTYTPDSTGGTFITPPVTAPWVLNLYPSRVTTEGSSSAVQQYCFDPGTGFLRGLRVLASGSGATNTDVVTAYCDVDGVQCTGGDGNVRRETFFGGDRNPLTGAGSLCDILPTPGVVEYDLHHTDQYGVRSSSQYFSAGSPLSFKVLDRTIDLSTALVSASRDVSGLSTGYAYDSMRRLKVASQTGVAPITYNYTNATATTPMKIVTTQVSGSFPSAGTRKQETQLDFLGRVWRESTFMPDGTWSVRQHHYDAGGRQDRLSTPQSSGLQPPDNSFSPLHETVFSNFDPFGRPRTITPPDNTPAQNKTTTVAYTGARVVERTVRMGAGLTPGTTREIYDGLGRLYQVQEPGSDGTLNAPNSTTTYTYDIGGRLARVDMVAGLVTQSRTFSYDNRGFLGQETHPENGTTTYTSFDARGHPRYRTLNAASDIFDLRFTWDAAERLTEVDSRDPANPSQYRISKSFTFGMANVGSNLQNGKLVSAVRHNDQSGGMDLTVSDTYEYADAAGRLTKKTTAIRNANAVGSDPLQQTVDQTYTYNDLGLPAQITYPGNCTPIPCGENAAWNTIAPGYSGGQLHDVPAFATSVGYAPSGAVQSVQHANGVLDTTTPDPNGLARPASMTFTGTAPCSVAAINSAPDQTVPYGTSATLTVSASGTPLLAFQWHTGGANPTDANKIPGATASTYTTPPVTTVTTYWIVVFNSCGHAQQLVTVTPTLSPPSSLSATATTATQVAITWNAAANADHYELERRSNGGSFTLIATPSLTSYSDTFVAANTTYVYRARSADSTSTVLSVYSNNDLATTATFSPVVAGTTVIESAHFDELLGAVNLVRAASGGAALTWSAILPAGIPAPAAGVVVYRDHLTSLRGQMDGALWALGLATSGYTDPVVDNTVPIRAEHILELRSRTQ